MNNINYLIIYLKGMAMGISDLIPGISGGTIALITGVYDDFISNKKQTENQKLIDVRLVFEKYNLISGLHTYCSQEDKIYNNILPPLKLLNKEEEKDLMQQLKNLNFSIKSSLAA